MALAVRPGSHVVDLTADGEHLRLGQTPTDRPLDQLVRMMAAPIPHPSPWNDSLGPFYDSTGVRLLLGVTRQALAQQRSRRTILALETADGQLLYPTFQFDEHRRVLPGLAEVLGAVPAGAVDGWTLASWLNRSRLAELGGTVGPALRPRAKRQATCQLPVLIEGIADYLAYSWWRATYGVEDADRLALELFEGRLALDRPFATTHVPVAPPSGMTDAEGRALVYGRPSAAWVALEGTVGVASTHQVLRAVHEAGREANPTIDDVIDAVAAAVPDAAPVLQRWWPDTSFEPRLPAS